MRPFMTIELISKLMEAIKRHPKFNPYVETVEAPHDFGPRPRLWCAHCPKKEREDFLCFHEVPIEQLIMPIVDTIPTGLMFRSRDRWLGDSVIEVELLSGQCSRCGLKLNVVVFRERRLQ